MKCPKCGSTQVSKNGHHHSKQNYICKQCGRQFVKFYNSRGYSDDVKDICLRMYRNGMGFRAIERATGISHNTIINWVRQAEQDSPGTPESREISEDTELSSLQIRSGLEKNKTQFLAIVITWKKNMKKYYSRCFGQLNHKSLCYSSSIKISQIPAPLLL